MTSADDVFHEVTTAGRSLTAKVADLLDQILCDERDNNHQMALPQHHPLGFFCLRWNLDIGHSVRVHIWDRRFDWTQHPNWPIHDHVFSFRSAVLIGSIQNKTYEPVLHTNRRAWKIYEVGYLNDSSMLTQKTHSVALKVSNSTLQPAGSFYELPSGMLHRSTLRSDIAITVLATTVNSIGLHRPRVVGVSNRERLSFDRFTADAENTNQIIHRSIAFLRQKAQGIQGMPCNALQAPHNGSES